MSAAVDRVFEALEAAECRPKWNGASFHARCPAHDDHRDSLTGSRGDDGRALLNCHAGCAFDQIVAALGLTMSDLFERRNGNGAKREVAAYDYTDEAGTLLFQVVRFEPKDFRQRRPDVAGGWAWKLGKTRRVLYRLPEVIATVQDGGTIYLTEGEKDADAINALPDGNMLATTNPGGAGKWRPEFPEVLRGAAVVIVQDKDDAGRRHARQVAASLKGVAASTRIVEAQVGKDAADHLASGHTLEDFLPVTDYPSNTTIISTPESYHVDLADTVTTFRRWLHLPDPDSLYAVLGAVAANRLQGDPVWLLLVGGSSWGKSEILASTAGLADIHPAATITEAALLSGTPSAYCSARTSAPS